jgi:hypothetical protein
VGARQDPASVGCGPGELAEQAAALLLAGQEAEVVPEEQDRVEALVRRYGAIERSEPDIGEPTPPCDLDGQRRDIDPDDLVSAALEVETDAAGTAAEVEHPSADETHGAALLRPPRPKRRQIPARVAGEDASIVALDDLDDVTARHEIGQHVAEGIFSGCERRPQQAG